MSQVISNTGRQESIQQQKPLTLTQLEKLIRNPASNERNAKAKDQAIAAEIRNRGVAFQLTDFVLESFRKLGAGPVTIQAIEDLKKRSKNIETRSESSSHKIIILVADFQGPEIEKSSVTSTIIDELSEATRRYSDVEVISLNEPITAKQGRKWAGEKGKEHNASIVLWGWYEINQGQVLVNVHFQVLQGSLDFLFFSEKQTLLLPIADFLSFQIRLSKEMAYLTFFTAGFVRYQEGDLTGAAELFTKAIEESNVPQRMVNPADAYFFRSSATILQSWLALNKVPDQAFEDLQQVITLKPEDAEAYRCRCAAHTMRKEYDLALADCNKAIELEPNGADEYAARASYYIQKDDNKSAVADIETALKLARSDPDDVRIFYYRGLLSQLKEDIDGVISNYSQLISEDVNPLFLQPFLIARASAYLEKDLNDLAITDLKQAIEMTPQSPVAYWLLGSAFYNKGDLNLAISNYRRAIDLGLNEAEIYVDLGDAYKAKKDISKAIDSYSKAIIIDPEYKEAYESRVFLYTQRNDFDKVIGDYNKLISLDPNAGHNYFLRGYAYYRKGDFERALSDYGKAIELIPQNAQIHFFRGLTYEAKGELDRALDDYGLAAKFDSKYALAHFYRGELYSRKGNYDQAINEYSQAIKISPNYVDAYLSRGKAYVVKSDHKSATSDLTKVLQLTSDLQIRKKAEQILDSLGMKQSLPNRDR
ncbi:MAG TPA: tetratricopeptide repeat protein [Pyrinomonadaceae bacterium]